MRLTFPETIDYYNLYCNIESPDFLRSLALEKSELIVFYLLMFPAIAARQCHVPDFSLEKLVYNENTPYQALRTLHRLRENRIIFYDLTETHAQETPFDKADIIDIAYEKALNENPESPAAIYQHQKPQRPAVYEHYATLNIEYPVVFHCFREESKFRENWDVDTDLQLMYTAIRGNLLAKALKDAGFPIVLEMLQYIQSLYKLPLTQEETHERPLSNQGDQTEG